MKDPRLENMEDDEKVETMEYIRNMGQERIEDFFVGMRDDE